MKWSRIFCNGKSRLPICCSGRESEKCGNQRHSHRASYLHIHTAFDILCNWDPSCPGSHTKVVSQHIKSSRQFLFQKQIATIYRLYRLYRLILQFIECIACLKHSSCSVNAYWYDLICLESLLFKWTSNQISLRL